MDDPERVRRVPTPLSRLPRLMEGMGRWPRREKQPVGPLAASLAQRSSTFGKRSGGRTSMSRCSIRSCTQCAIWLFEAGMLLRVKAMGSKSFVLKRSGSDFSTSSSVRCWWRSMCFGATLSAAGAARSKKSSSRCSVCPKLPVLDILYSVGSLAGEGQPPRRPRHELWDLRYPYRRTLPTTFRSTGESIAGSFFFALNKFHFDMVGGAGVREKPQRSPGRSSGAIPRSGCTTTLDGMAKVVGRGREGGGKD